MDDVARSDEGACQDGFPIVPRFAVSADPEATASSPIVRSVDRLARRNLLHTWQRPPLPQYSAIERVLERKSTTR